MSEKSKKVYVKGHTPFKYYRDFSISTALITLAILAPSLAFIGAYKPENHELNIWFQRSGSLAVLLSLTAEYVISRLHNIMCPSGFTSIDTEQIRTKLETPLMILRYVGGTVAVLGTIIWGYGDMVIYYYKTHNKCINADLFYTPLRCTTLCVKLSGYAKR